MVPGIFRPLFAPGSPRSAMVLCNFLIYSVSQKAPPSFSGSAFRDVLIFNYLQAAIAELSLSRAFIAEVNRLRLC